MFENEERVNSSIHNKTNTKNQDFFKVIAGIVGRGSALSFSGFMDSTVKAVPVEEILKNPHKTRFNKITEIDALHATTESLVHYIKNEKPKEWEAGLIYAIRDDHPLPELALILATEMTEIIVESLSDEDRIKAFDSKAFEIANDKFGDYITAVACS
jgi:hypothetical protein